MKKLIVCVAFISLLCGCKHQGLGVHSSISNNADSSNQQNQSDMVSGSKLSPNFFTGSIESAIDNNTDNNRLIKQLYQENAILSDLLFFTRFSTATSNSFFYSDILEKYKVECVRETASTRYAVFKTQENGLLYTFFNEEWEFEGNPSIRFSVYCKKKLSSTDFQSIEIGSVIKQVADIDPIVTATLKPIEHLKKSFYTLHMLTDGLIMMLYNYDVTQQTWVVSEILNSQNSKLQMQDKLFDCTILEQDSVK